MKGVAMAALVLGATAIRSAAGGSVCVWNQAYEEDGNIDSLNKILGDGGPRKCAVLVDTDELRDSRKFYLFWILKIESLPG